MTGIEVLAGAALTYLVRKLRRVGGRVDADIDKGMDAGLDALEGLVFGKLGDDPALAALREQAAEGSESERTTRRVHDAIADAAESDADFAQELQRLVAALQEQDQQGAGQTSIVNQKAKATGHGRVYQAGRDQTINER